MNILSLMKAGIKMNTQNSQTNQSNTNQGSTYNNGNSGQNQNQYQNHNTQNSGAYGYNTPPRPNYPKRRSTAAMVAGLVLILMGTSYIANKFMPWVFEWLDSGLVIAGVAIVAGFALLVKK